MAIAGDAYEEVASLVGRQRADLVGRHRWSVHERRDDPENPAGLDGPAESDPEDGVGVTDSCGREVTSRRQSGQHPLNVRWLQLRQRDLADSGLDIRSTVPV